MPVDVIYNSKDLHVTKIPENVDVNLTGPQSKLIKIENPEDLKVVVIFLKKQEISKNIKLEA